jgi:hypothetical protein
MDTVLLFEFGQPSDGDIVLIFKLQSFVKSMAFYAHVVPETDVPSACFWLNH